MFTVTKRSMKLGDYPQLDMADARHRALDHRAQIATDLDPQGDNHSHVLEIEHSLRIINFALFPKVNT